MRSGGRGPAAAPRSLVQAIERLRPRSDEPTVEGELARFPDERSQEPFDLELAEAALEDVDRLLDLFADGLDEIHPRLTRTRGHDRPADGDEPS
jgi:hypothetical protein